MADPQQVVQAAIAGRSSAVVDGVAALLQARAQEVLSDRYGAEPAPEGNLDDQGDGDHDPDQSDQPQGDGNEEA